MKNRTTIQDTVSNVGESVTIAGWVSSRRDHGKLIFLDVRDATGVVQVVVSGKNESAYEIANALREEWVVTITGEVKERPESMRNDEIATGSIEISATGIEVLNEAQTPPFPLDTEGLDIEEELRLQYRYVDLRRARLQKNIRLRSEFVDRIRQFLFARQFTEIETPLLTKSTPEGSRDFVVPSRLHKGKFFALPQSPQQYKQLLMVAGFEKYFQMARCLRDEDLRADRGFEHTQIDMEMSFVDEAEIRALDEEMITTVFEQMGYTMKEKPFPIFTYKEAMEKYGADKFDMRTEEDKVNNVMAFAWVVDFPMFEKVEKNEGPAPHKATQDTSSPALRSPEGAQKWTFTHNPFSMPKEEYIQDVLEGKNLEGILAQQYDLVCNGYETGGGSIRAHKPEILRAVFGILGYTEEQIQEQFGHMLEALSFGAPPHGGIAHGVERLMMIMSGEDYLREVQAFPQTSSGRTAVTDAPSELTDAQMEELGITVVKKKGGKDE
ncbi:MAG: aspartate--tRNA ligase [Candidatus Spechtbacterales bacterium]